MPTAKPDPVPTEDPEDHYFEVTYPDTRTDAGEVRRFNTLVADSVAINLYCGAIIPQEREIVCPKNTTRRYHAISYDIAVYGDDIEGENDAIDAMCGRVVRRHVPGIDGRYEAEWTHIKTKWITDRLWNEASLTYPNELGHRMNTAYRIAVDGYLTNTTGQTAHGADFHIDCSVGGEHVYSYEVNWAFYLNPEGTVRFHTFDPPAPPVYQHGIRLVGGFFNGYIEESLAYEESRDDADLPDRWWHVYHPDYHLSESEWTEIEPPDVTTQPECDVTVLLSPDINYTNAIGADKQDTVTYEAPLTEPANPLDSWPTDVHSCRFVQGDGHVWMEVLWTLTNPTDTEYVSFDTHYIAMTSKEVVSELSFKVPEYNLVLKLTEVVDSRGLS